MNIKTLTTADGWKSILTGILSKKDKRSSYNFTRTKMLDNDKWTLYENDLMLKKIINLIPDTALKEPIKLINSNAEALQNIHDFLDKIKLLKDNGLVLNKPFKDGNTMYHIAVAKNDLQLIKKLEGLGIDINTRNVEGLTALHKAALVAKDDVILKYLLSLNANKSIKTDLDETAYDLAKENEVLIQNKVNIDFLK